MSEAKNNLQEVELDDLQIRKATVDDVPFIAEVIMAAESSSTDTVSYKQLFDLNDDELKEFLSAMLVEDVPDHELCYRSYFIAEFEGAPVAGFGAYVEQLNGIPSETIKATLMAKTIGIEKWKKAADAMRMLSKLNIERTPGALQLEYAFTVPDLQCKGIHLFLGDYAITEMKKEYPELKYAESQTTKQNLPVIVTGRFYGFKVTEIKETDDPDVFKYLPFNNRVIMRYAYDENEELEEADLSVIEGYTFR